MRKQTKRALSLLLALLLCLGLLPMAAAAEEETEEKEFWIQFIAFPGQLSDGKDSVMIRTTSGGDESTKHMVQPPADPHRDGYLFGGWYVTSPDENPSVANRNFNSDTTVQAHWIANPNTFVLLLNPNGGDLPAGADKTVRLDTETSSAPTLKKELPVPTREGYTFDGWYRDGFTAPVKVGDVFSDSETTLTAQWVKDGEAEKDASVRVDFVPNGGTITSIRGIPAGDILAGSEQATKHNIFVDRNSGIGMMMTDEYGCLDSFPEIEREGYTFEGWYIVSSIDYSGETSIPSGAKKASLSTVFKDGGFLAAKWTEAKEPSKPANPDGPFTVTFFLNNGTGPVPKPQTVKKGGTVDLPDAKNLTPPRSSYAFGAWAYLGSDGNLYVWPEDQPVTSDLALFAGWVLKGKVVVDGEPLDAQPGETAKPAETGKPAEAEKPAAPAFTDVAAASPFAPAISWAVEKGITKGKTDTIFAPGEPCTRAQIVTFLWRAAGSPEPKAQEAEYADVTNTSAYYYKAIQWAAEMGMEESGTFAPDKPCTRGQAMYFIWKARAGASSAGSAPHFTDLSRDSLYYDAVLWAVGQGVTNGTGDGTTFSPESTCTRGQIVTFLYRAYEK